MRPLVIHSLCLLCCSASLPANEALKLLESNPSPSAMPVVQPEATAEAEKTPRALKPSDYPEPTWPTSRFDAIWARSVLFSNPDHPWIQQVAIAAFFDANAAWGTANVDRVGTTASKEVTLDGTQSRHTRIGTRIRAFRHTELRAMAELNASNLQRGVERLYARTEISDNTAVSYGKFRPDFSAEYRMEPGELPFPGRSMLTNQLAPNPTLGVRVEHRHRDWDYAASWFSDDFHPDLPGIEGNGMLLFNLGKTFVHQVGQSFRRTRWHFDYLHHLSPGGSDTLPRHRLAGKTSANGNQTITRNQEFRHLLSTGFTIEQQKVEVLTNFLLGKGDQTVWGMTVAPSYWLIPGKLRAVSRYHYASTDDPGALVTTMGTNNDLALDQSPFFIGDDYHSFYLGLNAHLHEDKLWLHAGAEKVILNDESGRNFNTEAFIWHTGLNFGF